MLCQAPEPPEAPVLDMAPHLSGSQAEKRVAIFPAELLQWKLKFPTESEIRQK